MKTTGALLFIALVTLLPISANATTLTITGGSAVLSHELGLRALFGSPPDGDDFSVATLQERGCCGSVPLAFGSDPFVLSAVFNTSTLSEGPRSDVRVGTQHCTGSTFPGGVTCGFIRITSLGLAMPADWPITTPFVATAPFTATGQLLVEGNQYDLVGNGTVTGTRCLTPCGLDTAFLAYTFSVGEPPSLVLMVASIIATGIVFVVHRRSVVRS